MLYLQILGIYSLLLVNGVMASGKSARVLFAKGDGIGAEVIGSSIAVIDSAVEAAYSGRRIVWEEVFLGDSAVEEFGKRLPEESLSKVRERGLLLKGPLRTPVGGGERSLNVALRMELDLYANIRPVRYFAGVDSPLKRPEAVDLVIMRENTDDLYTGIEWRHASREAAALRAFLKKDLGVVLPSDAGIGIKLISRFKTRRVARMAAAYALSNSRRSITIMHKGNIMKYTEGAFREWAYEAVLERLGTKAVTEEQLAERGAVKAPKGRILVNDRIADNMFQQLIAKPGSYDIILAPNLNGDYISDAAGALVGNIGVLGSAEIGDSAAMFEAVHGTAPKYAGRNVADPIGEIMAGAMMLEHLGWKEAAGTIRDAVDRVVKSGIVTQDLARGLVGVKTVGTKEFTRAVQKAIDS